MYYKVKAHFVSLYYCAVQCDLIINKLFHHDFFLRQWENDFKSFNSFKSINDKMMSLCISQCGRHKETCQYITSSPGVHCPWRPGGYSAPGCRSACCRSCWWSAAVFRRDRLGPAAPRWTAAAAPWHWPHAPPSPGGTGRSGRLP